MFISDEVRAAVGPAAATARLAALARGTALACASHAAWAVAAAAGGASAEPGHPALARVHYRGPVQHGATAMLVLRWEADDGGQLYPALDADITLIPDGEHAVLIGLSGVCRLSPGTRSGRPVPPTAAVRALLNRIADAVSDAASAEDPRPTSIARRGAEGAPAG